MLALRTCTTFLRNVARPSTRARQMINGGGLCLRSRSTRNRGRNQNPREATPHHCSDSSTSAEWPLGLTRSKTLRIRPSAPITKVVRRMPWNLRPYIERSPHAP